jgi:endoglycosylceramidase
MFTKDGDLSTVKPAKADLLVRPFARAVAGVPTSMGYEPTIGVFVLSYQAKKGVTEVVLPKRHYPHGYHVVLTGAKVVSAPNAPVLLLRTKGPGQVQVWVNRL